MICTSQAMVMVSSISWLVSITRYFFLRLPNHSQCNALDAIFRLVLWVLVGDGRPKPLILVSFSTFHHCLLTEVQLPPFAQQGLVVQLFLNSGQLSGSVVTQWWHAKSRNFGNSKSKTDYELFGFGRFSGSNLVSEPTGQNGQNNSKHIICRWNKWTRIQVAKCSAWQSTFSFSMFQWFI